MDEQQSQSPSFIEKLQMEPAALWKSYKVFFIVFGLLILVIKFRETIIDILVSSSKVTLDNTQKQDTQLKADENKTNSQANKLVDYAKKLGDNKPKVDEDWNK